MRLCVAAASLTLMSVTGCLQTTGGGTREQTVNGSLDGHISYRFEMHRDEMDLTILRDGQAVGWFICTTQELRAGVTSLGHSHSNDYQDISIRADTNSVIYSRWSRYGDRAVVIGDRDGDGLPDYRGATTPTNRVLEDISHTFTIRSQGAPNRADAGSLPVRTDE